MPQEAKATTAPGAATVPGNTTATVPPNSHDGQAGLGPVRRTVREVGFALMTAGVIILLFVAYELVGTNLTARHHQASLSRQFAQALRRDTRLARHASTARHPSATQHASNTGHPAAHTHPAGSTASAGATASAEAPNPSVPLGGAIDHLVIPAIGVNRYVVQGTGVAQLQEGPGHYVGTALPGQTGNVAIAGHRTTFGAPFFELNELKPGDVIELTDLADRTWVYRVTGQEVVAPTDVSVIAPTKTARLTLTTCTPRYWATDRLVVVASLVGQRRLPPSPVHHAATHTPRLSTLPGDATPKQHTPKQHAPKQHAPKQQAATSRLGAGDGNAWPGAVGFGLLVILGWALVRILAARSRRWRRAAVLAAGIAVCAVPLWFAFASVVRLLPSNL